MRTIVNVSPASGDEDHHELGIELECQPEVSSYWAVAVGRCASRDERRDLGDSQKEEVDMG